MLLQMKYRRKLYRYKAKDQGQIELTHILIFDWYHKLKY